jgi:hypothetical protein
MDAAETFRLAGRAKDATAAARRAETTYATKGMIVSAEGARAFREHLEADTRK